MFGAASIHGPPETPKHHLMETYEAMGRDTTTLQEWWAWCPKVGIVVMLGARGYEAGSG